MSNATIPADVRMQVMGILQGYERNRREFMSRRRDILDGGTVHYMSSDGGRDHKRLSRSSENKQAQLEDLSRCYVFRQVIVVDHALTTVCEDFPEEIAKALRSALLQNCESGRENPYERLCLSGISRSSFYRIKQALFYEIAKGLQLIIL